MNDNGVRKLIPAEIALRLLEAFKTVMGDSTHGQHMTWTARLRRGAEAIEEADEALRKLGCDAGDLPASGMGDAILRRIESKGEAVT